jgi:type II secretory pathway component PulF
MSFGLTGRFFGQLALCFRQGIPLMNALDLIASDRRDPEWAKAVVRIRDRIASGAALTESLAELPAAFARDVLPLLREAENEGLLDLSCDVLEAWPDAGATGVEACLARILAEASIRVRRGQAIGEAFVAARRPSDPDLLGQALDALAAGFQGPESPEQAMARFPGVFSPAVRGMIQQMTWNGTAEKTFREVALALSRGWFPLERTPGSPEA